MYDIKDSYLILMIFKQIYLTFTWDWIGLGWIGVYDTILFTNKIT